MTSQKKATKVKSCAQAYKRLFNTVDGGLVLQDMMRGHGYIESRFTKDPVEAAYLQGQRHVVERIVKLMKLDLQAIDKKIEQALRKDPFWEDNQD